MPNNQSLGGTQGPYFTFGGMGPAPPAVADYPGMHMSMNNGSNSSLTSSNLVPRNAPNMSPAHLYSFMTTMQPSYNSSTGRVPDMGAAAAYMAVSGGAPPPTRFRAKPVCKLDCKYCRSPVCYRAMKAVLLADAHVELFSTDCPPKTVGLFGDDYTTEKCQCRIRDVACMTCGNQVGYHVTQPCKSCLDACNNGHMHMYHSEHITSSERVDTDNGRPLVWATIPAPDRDADGLTLTHEETCR